MAWGRGRGRQMAVPAAQASPGETPIAGRRRQLRRVWQAAPLLALLLAGCAPAGDPVGSDTGHRPLAGFYGAASGGF